jgi:hypothetical protein
MREGGRQLTDRELSRDAGEIGKWWDSGIFFVEFPESLITIKNTT